ncbi:TetR family transcriptional regulator C-terminal domain-containing protein [Rhizobium sp. Root482]|jgi:AcrR family transcriptional regulator|uniref:TetR family transcriptional regulator C-terminal domain-containing protein n=1 Tax=Rhizobium sp. Root482 TaxID=1736543 RepID=UPI0006F65283|nr:TetR family transcriptional regulator C-terminal domain-containing protein [Rhizobium sp. Root482]KQY23937.1 TetR family transcriptional regulator [Rhizobium sp. Root482]
MNRRTFHRAPEGERRQDLIEATLDTIAELGLQGATVRQIAIRAGVTAGLMRHYFASKDQMVAEAYRAMLANFAARAGDVAGEPGPRLRQFIVLNLTAPVANDRSLSLWASFISQVRVDSELAAIHREGYLAFRNDLQALIRDFLVAEGRPADEAECRRHAIAINGIIDGLWLEGCLAGELFEEAELASIALSAIEALLGLSLGSH